MQEHRVVGRWMERGRMGMTTRKVGLFYQRDEKSKSITRHVKRFKDLDSNIVMDC